MRWRIKSPAYPVCAQLLVQAQINENIICRSRDIVLTHLSFDFKDRTRSENETLSGIFKIHAINIIASISLTIWKLEGKFCKTKPFWWRHKWCYSGTYHSLYSCLGDGSSESKFQSQYTGNECGYHNHNSRLHMTKAGLRKKYFSRS